MLFATEGRGHWGQQCSAFLRVKLSPAPRSSRGSPEGAWALGPRVGTFTLKERDQQQGRKWQGWGQPGCGHPAALTAGWASPWWSPLWASTSRGGEEAGLQGSGALTPDYFIVHFKDQKPLPGWT